MNISNDPAHHVYNGDCVDVMRSWAGQFSSPFIFADPPFNIGEPYDCHDDKMATAKFFRFTDQWIHAATALLKDGGVFAINIPDAMVGVVLTSAGLANLQRIDWIIWHYRFGQCTRAKFISSHTHCLVFRKGDEPHTFNSNDILVESDRSTKYNDSRTLQSGTPGLRVPFDVWCDIPRVVGNSKERIAGHPNQIPERYLERLVSAYTNVGECVLDPFGGSGTSAVVAKRLGRWSVSIEKSLPYCQDIVSRLKSVVV